MKAMLLALVVTLTGCTTTAVSHHTPSAAAVDYSDTMDIIRRTADAAPHAITGQYTLKIKATGTQHGYVYLNTQEDYRDQRCITVSLSPAAAIQFAEKYGMSPLEYFDDRAVVVNGPAKRVTVDFYSQGKRTKGYYYQTHIKVTDIAQIEVIDPPA